MNDLIAYWRNPPREIEADLIYVSPMLRCTESAQIIFPDRELIMLYDLRELAFGIFEGKTHEELQNDLNYQRFVTSLGAHPIPGGEDPAQFKERCKTALKFIATHMQENKKYTATVLTHGGVIMSIFNMFAKERENIYDYQVENGHGYIAEFDTEKSKLKTLGDI